MANETSANLGLKVSYGKLLMRSDQIWMQPNINMWHWVYLPKVYL